MRLQAAGRIQAIWNRVLGRSWLRSAAHESGGAGGHRVASLTATPAALRARLSVLVRRRPAAAGGLVVAALLLAACSGFTTGATNIAKQSDGSYSAQLNFVASCGSGEHCSWYVHYRRVGTSTWTNVPSTPHGPVTGPVSSVSLFEAATGLTAGARYEYQVCGNFQPGQPFICVGPDGQTNTTTKFTAAAWSLQSIPSHLDPTGVLSATSCSSATACTAVGSSSAGTLVERWDGSTWTTQTTPTPSGGSLNAVSCTSATDCTAVGNNGAGATLAEFWDGTSWTIETTPNPSGGTNSSLSAVSCASATACIAVGGTVAERWDGTSWTIQTTPTPSGGSLNAVSCSSANACTAVGLQIVACGIGCAIGPLAEQWDGSTWTIQTTPTSGGGGGLNTVSCSSASACTALGPGGVQRWDGSTWTIQSTPSGGGLNAVSCASATACTAVGSGSGGTLAERWDGSTWTTQTTPSPSGGDLNAVSCASATACTAVGHNGTEATLAEFWDGSTWTIQATPTPGVGLSVPSPFLGGVSCTSATACTAVGSFLVGGLAARWDGSSWTMQDATGGLMNGVSCTSASACIAVGTEESEFEGKMVWLPSAARWDGSTWTSQTLPAPSGADLSDLNGVSCTSATACTAVGYYISGNSNRPLAERWDGSTWTIQTTPTASGTTVSRLNGVSCTSATACTAVGDDNSNQVTLAERWNGSTWTIQATPSGVSLNGVSCTSATACIAVGSGGLAERWDGSTWTTQTTPSGGTLNAVSCTSATACTAVGESGPSIGNGGTLAERWDGTSWTIQTTPNPSGPPSSNLLGVSCTSATKCTAVGLSGDGQTIASISPLAERYSA